MQYRRLLLPFLGLLMTSCFGLAQLAVSVDSKTFNQHLFRSVPLVYPPIAKAANVQGTVVLQVQVDEFGKVESTKTISGPPMLIQAAIDSVKQWTFKPFTKGGSPTRASGRVSLVFGLAGLPAPTAKSPENAATTNFSEAVIVVHAQKAEGDDITDQYFDAWNLCMKDLSAKQWNVTTAATCKKAADNVEQFPPSGHFVEKRYAFVYAANAFRNIGDFKEALIYATKAVDITKLGHDIDAGSSVAYAIKGSIEVYQGDLPAADQDLGTSEGYMRKAIIWAKKEAPINIPSYRQELAQDLRFHAKVLTKMNRSSEATTKLQEASEL